MAYKELSAELIAQIERDKKSGTFGALAFRDGDAHRRDPARDAANLWRPAFVRDAEKILHCPLYNRYADKTQVFSLYLNDDITRRALHVQLVSRIARNIGRCLGLNLELIEAIALGHDIGHTPFGHAGEKLLSAVRSSHTGKPFLHNFQSVRVLDGMFPYNITIETLSGILAHNGELELSHYAPVPMEDFAAFDAAREDYAHADALMPSTLEGCAVRISDLIAYLGKDRQDAERASLSLAAFESGGIGTINAEIINNLTVSIIENSYGKPYIALGEEEFAALAQAKRENYEHIYGSPAVKKTHEILSPMFERLYERLLRDVVADKRSSPVFTHHVSLVEGAHYTRKSPYREEAPDDIVTDYIASMTDDYFVDLYAHFFPDSPAIPYIGYFDGDS